MKVTSMEGALLRLQPLARNRFGLLWLGVRPSAPARRFFLFIQLLGSKSERIKIQKGTSIG